MAQHIHTPGEETKQRLQAVAMELFAKKGFSDTTVRELTKQACCNVACVSYYFGNKEKLYEAVMLSVFRELTNRRVESLRRLVAEKAGRPSLREVLATFAEAFLGPFFLEEEGEIKLRLLVREMIQPLLPQETIQRELIQPVQDALTATLKAAVPEIPEQGILLASYSFVAQLVQIVHLHVFLPTSPAALSFSPQALVEHIVDFTEGGIQALAKLYKKVGST
ncbi:MAG: TetR/AcrR family transcriptional regulator [Thermoanaerobaculaceae bacterium]